MFGIIVTVTGQFADKPTRCQSSRVLVNSRSGLDDSQTSQHAVSEKVNIVFGVII